VVGRILYRPILKPSHRRGVAKFVIQEVKKAEKEYFSEKWAGDLLSDRLEEACDYQVYRNPERFRHITGVSCYSLESIPFAIGTFLRQYNSYAKGVLEAINSGGDTDSNAAMVGAMIGTNCGVRTIPRTWQYLTDKLDPRPVVIARELYKAAKGI